jgi:hypothetical protein
VQKERVTLPNGVIIFSGRSTATVTNLDTGASMTYNVSGPVQLQPSTNRVTLLGPSLVVEPDPDGFLIQSKGQVTSSSTSRSTSSSAPRGTCAPTWTEAHSGSVPALFATEAPLWGRVGTSPTVPPERVRPADFTARLRDSGLTS